MKKIYYSLILMSIFLITSTVNAEIIKFTNGDTINVTILSKNDKIIKVNSNNFGTLELSKKNIKAIETKDKIIEDKKAIKTKNIWKRKISTGYKMTRGNVEESSVFLKATAKRKTKTQETDLKASITESSSGKKMDSQKWKLSARHAFSFGDEKKWYNFYKLEADHSKFSNIDYRVLPSSGIGYWFSDEYPLKALAELAMGYTYTKYNDGSTKDSEITIIPRIFIDYEIYKKTTISEELIAYPSLATSDNYRLISTTTLSCPINKGLSLNLNFNNEYNNNPQGDAKKLDQILSTTLSYSF